MTRLLVNKAFDAIAKQRKLRKIYAIFIDENQDIIVQEITIGGSDGDEDDSLSSEDSQ